MNTQSNAIPESFQAQRVADARLSETRPLYWSVRRELWENRYIYIAPIAVAALFLLGFLISAIRIPHQVRSMASLDPMQQRIAMLKPYELSGGFLMVTSMIVAVFYCLSAFQNERRDRSILFWKSLPVSDLTTVLSKASVPLVILPLLSCSIAILLQWLMLMVSSAVLAGSGMSVANLWAQISLAQILALLLYHLITIHTLWHAPFYGYLLLVSAWARRVAFLWAALPVLALLVLEKLVFGSSHFARYMEYRLSGGGVEAMTLNGDMPTSPTTHITPAHFFASPGLWIGLAVTAACLLGAARLRRYRDPM